MRRFNKLAFLIMLSTLSIISPGSAASPPADWIRKRPLEPLAFVENKGQFEEKRIKNIRYKAKKDGLDYFFTPEGIYIKYATFIKKGGEHEDEEEEKESDNELEIKQHLHIMRFGGPYNKKSSLIAEQRITGNFHYHLEGSSSTTIACGYKKLTYHNLYKGIDLVLYFPEDSAGFKYSFVVKAGADPKDIRLEFPSSKLEAEAEGNLNIRSGFGTLTDHRPKAMEPGSGRPVACAFRIKGNGIGFQLGDYDHNSDLVIDPWTNPYTTAFGNYAFDVDWDYRGNVYVYGGNVASQSVTKYDSLGNFLWNYAAMSTSPFYLVGDFAVNKASGSVYIGRGANSASVEKVSTGGTYMQIYSFPNQELNEISRMAYSQNVNRLIVGGGGNNFGTNYYFVILDSSINALSWPINLNIGCCKDMWGLATNNTGDMYCSLSRDANIASLSNKLLKFSYPGYSSIAWSAPTGYEFRELSTTAYKNGFNCIAAAGLHVYTYNGHVVKKWNTAGTFVDSVITGPLSNPFSLYWGGISADSCENVFVGDRYRIQQYDVNLNLTDSIVLPDSIHDVNLGRQNKLYVCGYNFVARYSVVQPGCMGIGVGRRNLQNDEGFRIYPNPNTGDFELIANTSLQNAEIRIYSSTGQELMHKAIGTGVNRVRLQPVPNKGVYSYRIVDEGRQLYLGKFIIE